MRTHTYTHTHARVRTRTHVRTHSHTCARRRMHACTHARTHTHTHTRARGEVEGCAAGGAEPALNDVRMIRRLARPFLATRSLSRRHGLSPFARARGSGLQVLRGPFRPCCFDDPCRRRLGVARLVRDGMSLGVSAASGPRRRKSPRGLKRPLGGRAAPAASRGRAPSLKAQPGASAQAA